LSSKDHADITDDDGDGDGDDDDDLHKKLMKVHLNIRPLWNSILNHIVAVYFPASIRDFRKGLVVLVLLPLSVTSYTL